MSLSVARGMKNDLHKLPMHLLDRHAIEKVAAVLQYGADKYSAHNWRGGIEFTRLIAAAQRHLFAITDGEDNDPESGLPHAAHAMCCLMFLLWMMEHRRDLDDRYITGLNYESLKRLSTALEDDMRRTVKEQFGAEGQAND